MNEKKLTELIAKDKKNLYGILAMQNNAEIYSYKNPKTPHAQLKENEAFHVASVTKSILSLLIGIAIDHGFIKSTDQKVLDFFPEYICPPDELIKKTITIKNLLTMTVPYPFPNWKEPLERFCRHPDWTANMLDIFRNKGSGSVGSFKYTSFGAHLLSVILTRASGTNAESFINKYLFSPLGLPVLLENPNQGYEFEDLFLKSTRGWAHDRQNHSTGGWGLCLTLQDMVQIGNLCLHNGIFNGKQIISASYLKDCFTPAFEKPVYETFNYGYLWWLDSINDKQAMLACGNGGNVLCIIPEANMSIAIAANVTGKEVNFPAILRELTI